MVAGPPDAAKDASFENVRALVVDDNPTSLQVLNDLLLRWGIQVSLANDGAAALRALHRSLAAGQPFRLLIADSYMPEMDGFTLVEKIQQAPELAQTLVILMLRSGDQWRAAARCRKLGIAVHLTKPIRRGELRQAILATLYPGLVAPAAPKDGEASAAEDHPRVNLRILVAEDNPVNQAVARRLLQKRGHIVTTVDNGREAVAGHMRMIGLLHDVGRLVLAANLPENFERAHRLALEKQIVHWEAEREVFGTTHAEVGAYLLGLWGLPETIVEAVAYHHTPARCPHPGSAMFTALHVASVLAAAMPGHDAPLHCAEPDLDYLASLALAGRLPEWREFVPPDGRRRGGPWLRKSYASMTS